MVCLGYIGFRVQENVIVCWLPMFVQGLPGFWLRALKANRLLADTIEDHDEAPLSYLQNIECEWLAPEAAAAAAPAATAAAAVGAPHPESFRLVFYFVENPFFKPLKLVKEYHLSTAPGGKGAELTKTQSTQVQWAPDKDVTKKTIFRKQRNRKTKQTRTVAETVDASSFFNLFVDHEIPSDDKLEEMPENEVRHHQDIVRFMVYQGLG